MLGLIWNFSIEIVENSVYKTEFPMRIIAIDFVAPFVA